MFKELAQKRARSIVDINIFNGNKRRDDGIDGGDYNDVLD